MASSIRALARELGIDPSTVSRGLRGEGRMSTELRKRIREAAEQAGYRVHPLLSEALAMSRQPVGQRYRETFALILEFPSEGGPDYQQIMHYAAEERAASMGCRLEPFIVSSRPPEQRRWSSIFQARGIRGLIIVPRLLVRQPRMHLDWPRFAAVQIFQTLRHPRHLHRVESDTFSKIIEAVHLLKRAGYRRIGMAVETVHNQQKDGEFYGAYLMSQLRWPARDHIPIYAHDGKRNEETFRKWYEAYRPEVIMLHRYMDICQWIGNLGLRMPEDVSLFQVDVRNFTDDPEPYRSIVWSGIRLDYAAIGQRSVDLLITLLRNGEMGLPEKAAAIRVGDSWVEGNTLSQPIGHLIGEAPGRKAPGRPV